MSVLPESHRRGDQLPPVRWTTDLPLWSRVAIGLPVQDGRITVAQCQRRHDRRPRSCRSRTSPRPQPPRSKPGVSPRCGGSPLQPLLSPVLSITEIKNPRTGRHLGRRASPPSAPLHYCALVAVPDRVQRLRRPHPRSQSRIVRRRGVTQRTSPVLTQRVDLHQRTRHIRRIPIGDRHRRQQLHRRRRSRDSARPACHQRNQRRRVDIDRRYPAAMLHMVSSVTIDQQPTNQTGTLRGSEGHGFQGCHVPDRSSRCRTTTTSSTVMHPRSR